MKKIKMSRGTTLTFEEGCNKYLVYCGQRNLRQGTINHYKQSYYNTKSWLREYKKRLVYEIVAIHRWATFYVFVNKQKY